MKTKIKWAFIMLTMVAVLGCGSEGSQHTLTTLDIVGAKYLFVSPSSASSSLSKDLGDYNDKLFKITEDGYVLEVTGTDENGDPYTFLQSPAGVDNAGADYVIVSFSGCSEVYLVRKSDGAVFDLEAIGCPQSPDNYFKNADLVYTDSVGNIYYIANTLLELAKVDISDPNSPKVTTVPATTDSVFFGGTNPFVVTPDGVIMYLDGKSDETRIKTINGSFHNLPGTVYGNFWLGYDGNIYYGATNIKKVLVDSDNNVSYVDYGGVSSPIEASYSYYFSFEDKTIIIDTRFGAFEVNNVAGVPRKVMDLPLNSIGIIAAISQDYVYLAGNDDSSGESSLIKIDPEAGTYENMYTPGLYDVYSMVVSDTDEVTFNATRMSDGAKIIAKISTPGADPVIIDATLNTQVTSLVRIN